MTDDSGGILSDITEAIGDVAGAAADELKKFGSSATSQIGSGHAQGGPGQPGGADLSKIKSAVGGTSVGDDQSVLDEVGGFGKSFLGQITGHMDAAGADIAKMAKADNKFSEVESAKVKTRINQIYVEHAAKRVREQQQKEIIENQQEEMKAAQQQQQKKEELGVNPAIAKTRAEIKNYGAE